MIRNRQRKSEQGDNSTKRQLRRAYVLMQRRFGHQHWWPGETPFEVCVGAILTQNTSWSNVERAIANLKRAGVMEPRPLLNLPRERLAELLRPSGYFNIKAQRLQNFLQVLVQDFGASLEKLFEGPTALVRERLLSINGIGAETADSMLLYAAGHSSFVIDAYTKRIFHRHGWRNGGPVFRRGDEGFSYDELKLLCETALNHKREADRLDYWQDYHAQLVMVGKHYCRTKNPLCEECPLNPLLVRPDARQKKSDPRDRIRS